MNYTFHQLKVFMAVVEKKSITKAALELHMTQPAVSIQLKNLHLDRIRNAIQMLGFEFSHRVNLDDIELK